MNRIQPCDPEQAEDDLHDAAEAAPRARVRDAVVADERAMTSATEPAAADTIAGRPPTNAITTAITTLENRPTAGRPPDDREGDRFPDEGQRRDDAGDDLAGEQARGAEGPEDARRASGRV